MQSKRLTCDVLIVGGGTGGTAAAIALRDKGLSVVLSEETTWIGGQLTSQAVPPDEHPWIETTGCTQRYRKFRNRVRKLAMQSPGFRWPAHQAGYLNPGGGWVSHIACLPADAHTVLNDMLQPESTPGLTVLLQHVPVAAERSSNRVQTVTLQCLLTGAKAEIEPRYVLDATELGDLLPMTGTEFVVGAESKTETNEPNALEGAAEPDNIQSFTWCAVIGYDEGGDHTIPEPEQYAFWKDHQPPNWPDKLLSFTMLHVQRGEPLHFPLFSDDWFNLFSYRQIVDPRSSTLPVQPATVMNWPMNDYALGNVLHGSAEDKAHHLHSARQLTLSMLYWLQHEHGYRGLCLRPDLTGTADGLAMAPYHRESRRIKALHTVTEQDVAAYTNPGLTLAPMMPKSVGVGAYRIDLHPSSNEQGLRSQSAACGQASEGR